MLPVLSTAYSAFAAIERVRQDACTLGFAFFYSDETPVNEVSSQYFELTFQDDSGTNILYKSGPDITFPTANRLVVTLSDQDKAVLFRQKYTYSLFNRTIKRTEVVGSFAWHKGRPSSQGVLTPADLKIVYSLASGEVSIGGLVIVGQKGETGPAWLVWRGAWKAGTVYAVGDGVYQGGNSYRRKIAGTSGAAFDEALWDLVALGGQPADRTVTPEKTTFAANFAKDGTFYITDSEGNVGLLLLPNGTLKVVRIDTLQNLLVNGIEFDLSSFLKSTNPDFNFVKTNFQPFAGNDLVITDPNGFIGWKLSADGVMSVLKAVISKLTIGASTTTEHPDFLLAASDANTAIGFAITKFSELLIKTVSAQIVNTKTLTVTESVNLPPSFNLADKLPFVYGKPTDWLHVISYGQSNSNGGGNLVPLTIVQKYDALMPKGTRMVGVGGDYSDLVPFVESLSECPLHGLFEKFTEQVIDQNFLAYPKHGFQLVATSPGQGGIDIANLSKGSAPYTKLVDGVTQINALAVRKAKSYSVGFIPWTQGEQDVAINTTYQSYKTMLLQLITDLNADIRAITGQKNPIPFVSYQVAWGNDLDRISKVHLDLGLTHPLYVTACPSYFFDFENPSIIHFTPAHRRIYGAYLALAAKRTMVDGVKFLPLHPIQLSVSGNTLTVTYHVPKPPLVFDTTLVPDPGSYGFKVFSSTGAVLTLTNIRIISKDTISMDCSASPVGGTFAYARNTGAQNWISPDSTYGKPGWRGCLRDSQGNSLTFDNYPLHNWAVASYLSI